VVLDAIEGWAQAIEVLVNSYFKGGAEIEFDFSAIRPKGSRLITAGGHAPGPYPLQEAIIKVKEVFDNAIVRRGEGTKLKPIEVHDINCFISKSVISGGIRRCLPGGTLVHTTAGMRPIVDVEIGEEVFTTKGVQKVKNKFVQGKQLVSEVHTDIGVYKATKNHRFAVLSESGGYEWKTVDTLTEKDQFIFSKTVLPGTTTSLPEDTTEERPEHSTTCASITIPELDTDIAWAIGYFHGNGYVYNRNHISEGKPSGSSHITLACDSRSTNIIAKLEDVLKRFGVTPKVNKMEGENTVRVIVTSQRLAEYFLKNIKAPKTIIRIPEWISMSTPDIRGAYLAGVIDSDGCIKNRPIKLCSSIYPEFIDDLQNLYTSLGIPTKKDGAKRKNPKWKDLYNLRLIGFRDEYNERIGTFSVKGNLPIKRPAMGYSVPGSIVKNFLEYKDYGKVWAGKGSMNYERFITFDKTKDLLPGVPINIRSVVLDTEEVDTYDIEVEIDHEFFVNGILSHNSAMIAGFSPDDEEMVTCKSGAWWEQNPQRALANNSVILHRGSTSKETFMELWEKVRESRAGEPGVYWTNVDDGSYFTNPCCLVGSTKLKVPLLNNKHGYVALADLVGEDKPVVKVVFANNSEIVCTPDHRFMNIDGEEVVAGEALGQILKVADGSGLLVEELSLAGEQEVFDFNLEGGLPWGVLENGVAVHNCEISLRSDGGFCNLTEIKAYDIYTQEELEARARAGAFLGTLQAGYTNFHFLRPQWRENAEEEALLGVSMTGIASNTIFPLDIKSAARAAVDENRKVAKMIGINPAKRIGAVKPAGTTSLVLSCSSGIHAAHDEYYIRRIRIDKNEALYSHLSKNHPELVEDEFFAPHKTAVISVPQKAPDGASLRTESPFDLLTRVQRIKKDWIDESHIEGPNTHNVSVTVSLKDEDWDAVGEWMWENKDDYNGISVLPFDGGTYRQAPFETITKEQYESMLPALRGIDLSRVIENDDLTDLQGELACSGGACELT